MQRMFLRILALTLLTSLCAYGQSLGDVARENRAQQAEDESGAKPRVITNKDLPPNPDGYAGPSSPEPNNPGRNAAEDRRIERRLAEQDQAEQRAAQQWRRQILAQEDRIANLQARIDRLTASIHFAGSAPSEGPSNRYQARQMLRVAEMENQLDEQRSRLYSMQEEARRAGMHTSVYDP